MNELSIPVKVLVNNCYERFRDEGWRNDEISEEDLRKEFTRHAQLWLEHEISKLNFKELKL